MDSLELPPSAVYVIRQLLPSPVYVVGGAVRRVFTGEPPSADVDLVVQDFEHAKRVLRPFFEKEEYMVIKMRLGGCEIDVAGFRREAYDGVSRKPVVRPAGSIEEDAARRDFTINAMYFEVKEAVGNRVYGRLVDLFGGAEDARRGLIRAVGDPVARIIEDPLRMLRAVRFASQLSFTIEERTLEAIKTMAGEIARVSKERMRDELLKSLSHNAGRTVELLWETGLWRYVAPFLGPMAQVRHDGRGHHYGETVLQHTVDALYRLQKLHGKGDPVAALAVLLHDAGKPAVAREDGGKITFHSHAEVSAEIAERWAGEMRLPRSVIGPVVKAVALHERLHQMAYSRTALAKFLVWHAEERGDVAELALKIAEADLGRRLDDVRAAMREMLSTPKLIRGADVMHLPPDARGWALKKAREMQLAKGAGAEELKKAVRGFVPPKQSV